jgi:hypothetical protein
MPRYRLRPDLWPKYRNRVAMRLTPVIVLAGVVGSLASLRDSETTVSPWLVALPMGALVVFGTLSGLRRTKQWFDSFEIELADDEIVRRQAQTADLILKRGEVTSIVESARGTTLIGSTRFRALGIPAEIDDYNIVAEHVRSWAPAVSPHPFSGGIAALVTGVAVVVLFGLAFIARPAVGAASAGLLAVSLSWVIVELRRNPNLESKTRRASWLLAMPLAALVVRVIRFFVLGE